MRVIVRLATLWAHVLEHWAIARKYGIADMPILRATSQSVRGTFIAKQGCASTMTLFFPKKHEKNHRSGNVSAALLSMCSLSLSLPPSLSLSPSPSLPQSPSLYLSVSLPLPISLCSLSVRLSWKKASCKFPLPRTWLSGLFLFFWPQYD
jgi:hypothetical protein